MGRSPFLAALAAAALVAVVLIGAQPDGRRWQRPSAAPDDDGTRLIALVVPEGRRWI